MAKALKLSQSEKDLDLFIQNKKFPYEMPDQGFMFLLNLIKPLAESANKTNAKTKITEGRDISRQKVVQWLWQTKIKSRDGFLLILEFIRIKRLKFKKVLAIIKPKGSLFFDTYVAKNFSF
jgi:hypothetical protein